MKKIVIRRYQDGEKLRTICIKQDVSATFGVEGDRFVVREYRTGRKIRSVQAPTCSITYRVEG
jgi:hypothetical protein